MNEHLDSIYRRLWVHFALKVGMSHLLALRYVPLYDHAGTCSVFRYGHVEYTNRLCPV